MKQTAAYLFLVLASVCILSAQDFNLTGAGARAEGIGGAFIGVADGVQLQTDILQPQIVPQTLTHHDQFGINVRTGEA